MSRLRFDLIAHADGRIEWRCGYCPAKGNAREYHPAINSASQHLTASHQAPGLTDEIVAASPD